MCTRQFFDREMNFLDRDLFPLPTLNRVLIAGVRLLVLHLSHRHPHTHNREIY